MKNCKFKASTCLLGKRESSDRRVQVPFLVIIHALWDGDNELRFVT